MKKLIASITICGLVLAGCGSSNENDDTVIRVGASAVPHAEILESIKDDLKAEGYELKITVYDDYVVPNEAVQNGEIDANYFQHKPYLDQFNEDHNTDIVPVAEVHFEPIGVYSKTPTKVSKEFSLADIHENDVISVPDDPTNEARALQLLQYHGIIELAPNVGLKATKADIVKNPKNVEILEVEANNVAATLDDVAFAVINGNYALTNELQDNLVASEDKNNDAIKDYVKEYANIVAVKKGNENDPKIKALVKAINSDKVRKFIQEKYRGLIISVF